MSERRRRRDNGRGFTLIEILIAFAILAVALAGLLRAFSSSLQATAKAERYGAAVLLARSVLERVGRELPILEGSQSGRGVDGTEWSIQMRPYDDGDRTPARDDPFPAYEIIVTVATDRQQPITLTTLRLAPRNIGGEADEPELDEPLDVGDGQ